MSGDCSGRREDEPRRQKEINNWSCYCDSDTLRLFTVLQSKQQMWAIAAADDGSCRSRGSNCGSEKTTTSKRLIYWHGSDLAWKQKRWSESSCHGPGRPAWGTTNNCVAPRLLQTSLMKNRLQLVSQQLQNVAGKMWSKCCELSTEFFVNFLILVKRNYW